MNHVSNHLPAHHAQLTKTKGLRQEPQCKEKTYSRNHLDLCSGKDLVRRSIARRFRRRRKECPRLREFAGRERPGLFGLRLEFELHPNLSNQ